MQGRYAPPEIVDYGDLLEITRGAYPPLGVAASQDMSFSAEQTPGGGGAGNGARGTVLEQVPAGGGPGGGGPTGGGGTEIGSGDVVVVGGVDQPGGGDSGGDGDGGDSGDSGGVGGPGGGGSGGGGGGGGDLPFTGLEAGAVAAAGTGLTAAGAALRKVLRRRSKR